MLHQSSLLSVFVKLSVVHASGLVFEKPNNAARRLIFHDEPQFFRNGKIMTGPSPNKKASISVLQRLGLVAVIGIVLAIIFNYFR